MGHRDQRTREILGVQGKGSQLRTELQQAPGNQGFPYYSPGSQDLASPGGPALIQEGCEPHLKGEDFSLLWQNGWSPTRPEVPAWKPSFCLHPKYRQLGTGKGVEETAKTWNRVTLRRGLESGQQMPRPSTRVGSWGSVSCKRFLRVWNSPHTLLLPLCLLPSHPPMLPSEQGRHRWPAVLLCCEGTGRGSGWAPSAEPRAARPRPGSHIWAVSEAIRPGGGCRDGPGARRGPQ